MSQIPAPQPAIPPQGEAPVSVEGRGVDAQKQAITSLQKFVSTLEQEMANEGDPQLKATIGGQLDSARNLMQQIMVGNSISARPEVSGPPGVIPPQTRSRIAPEQALLQQQAGPAGPPPGA